jgi:Holliday junction resolvasome RuvABC endonuclease subunit
MSLDVSSTSTGWSFISTDDNILKYGKIVPNKKSELTEKLTYFRKELIKVLKKYKPTDIVLEDTFVGLNPKVTKLLAKFGGIAEQTVFEYCNKAPYIMSNTKPKAFFKAKSKDLLFVLIKDLINFGNQDIRFKDWNDITDSVAQLLCYCDEILQIEKYREEYDYGYDFNKRF